MEDLLHSDTLIKVLIDTNCNPGKTFNCGYLKNTYFKQKTNNCVLSIKVNRWIISSFFSFEKSTNITFISKPYLKSLHGLKDLNLMTFSQIVFKMIPAENGRKFQLSLTCDYKV